MTSEKRWQTKSLEMTDSCFKEKLQIEKSNLTFREYVYSILFYLEKGETSLFGSSLYLALFLLMFLIGFKNLFGMVETCPFPERLISVCLMQSGILGSTIHAINLGFHLFGAKNRYFDKCKVVFRFVLLLNNVMGIIHLCSEVFPTAKTSLVSLHALVFNICVLS
ncbi:hypothetical protein JTE90_012359 [Oedothorax gibbosus]|uniref:Uncharacterized protein n=1 Tax=Oedothorax gibbosus TaxID=931172 RepID=A0AAV6V515_9ARAC|nr:hypothetical protein JTE90_012359 [Oedothorax gibbosus]